MRIMEDWLHQFNIEGPRDRRRFALEVVTVWVGDQFTAACLRGCHGFRNVDDSSYVRLDWLVKRFGWFHLVFALEDSLHTQYYGTPTGHGVVKAFDVMDRRYLETLSTQGIFHHTFEEAVTHTLEAPVFCLWCTVGGVGSVAELRNKPARELHFLASQIYYGYASTHYDLSSSKRIAFTSRTRQRVAPSPPGSRLAGKR